MNCLEVVVQNSDKHNFLFSYFIGNGEDGLHLAHSYDGYHWKALNNGNINGKWFVHFDKYTEKKCVITSNDLESWTDESEN